MSKEEGGMPPYDGAVVLRAGGWAGDRFVVEAERVRPYLDDPDWVVKPFWYSDNPEIIRVHAAADICDACVSAGKMDNGDPCICGGGE